MKRLIKSLATAVPGFVLLVGLVTTTFGSAVAHADTPAGTVAVTGTVTDTADNPYGAGTVSAISPSTGTVVATTYIDSNFDAEENTYAITYGSYEIDVVPGTYNFKFTPDTNWATTTIDNVSVNSNTILDAQISPQLATHVLSGVVTDNNTNPLPNMWIHVGPLIIRTNSLGAYSVSLPAVNYQGVYIANGQQFPQLPAHFIYNGVGASLSTTDAIRNYAMPPTVTLSVLVKNNSGTPDPGQIVEIDTYGVNPNGGSNPSAMTEFEDITTGTNGVATMPVWQGYALGSINASPVALFPLDNLRTLNEWPGVILSMGSNATLELHESDGLPYMQATPALNASSSGGSATLTWPSAPNAGAYAIYRDGAFLSWIDAGNTAYTDTTAASGVDHTYYIKSAINEYGDPSDRGYLSPASNTITLKSDGTVEGNNPGTLPTINPIATPVPNSAGWNNTPVTVSFSCAADIGIASCSSPQTFSNEGLNQTVTGVATDNNGQIASVTSLPINIDTTAPTASSFTLTRKTSAQSENFNVTATDALSGVTAGEFYFGTDPGQGNGTPMTYAGGQLSGTLGTNMPAGTYQVYVRAKDAADNWSAPVSAKLVVTQSGTTGVTASGSYTPTTANGNQLPMLGTASYVLAQYSSNVNFGNNGINSASNLSLTYKYGNSVTCGSSPTSPGCHLMTLASSGTSFSSIVFSGINNSNVTITGTMSVTIDGIVTTNPFTLTIYSASRGGSSTNSFQLNVYAPGSPTTPTNLLYKASSTGTISIQ